MIGGLNPKQMEKMMKQLGMKVEEIDAEVVIIRTKEKEIVIEKPSVQKVNMMGQDTFQIQGNVVERNLESFNEEDVKLVMEQAGVSEDLAREVLKETNGDIAEAILRLEEKKEKGD